jgi:hypothetical protein
MNNEDAKLLEAAQKAAANVPRSLLERARREMRLKGPLHYYKGGVCESGGAITLPFWSHWQIIPRTGRQRSHTARWTAFGLSRHNDALICEQLDKRFSYGTTLPSERRELDKLYAALKRNQKKAPFSLGSPAFRESQRLGAQIEEIGRRIARRQSQDVPPDMQERILNDYRSTPLDLLLIGSTVKVKGEWKLKR